MTGPGASITGATVTTDPTGHGGRTGHGAPTDQTGLIAPTDPIGRTGQIAPTGPIDQTGPKGLIAADQQSTARPGRTYNPAARTALAARRRRRHRTASSRAVRAAIPDGGAGHMRPLYLRPKPALEFLCSQRLCNSGPPFDRRPERLASDDHEITFSLADLKGQPQDADGVFRPGKP